MRTPEVEFVRAMPTDLDYLLTLRLQTMVEHLEAAGFFLTEAEHRQRINDNFECVHIIHNSGARVGMVKFCDSVRVEIMQLQISPEYQGKGIGKAVMESFIKRACARKQSILLTVLKRNPAKQLYERLGFQLTGEDAHEFHLCYRPGHGDT